MEDDKIVCGQCHNTFNKGEVVSDVICKNCATKNVKKADRKIGLRSWYESSLLVKLGYLVVFIAVAILVVLLVVNGVEPLYMK